jgi:sporulation protein YlmC with PRC-barrel domain
MRLSELRGKQVRSPDGASLGRIHEVHCDGGRVVALMCGPASLIERWTAKSRGRRVSWEEVVRTERGAVIVAKAEAEKRP